MLLHFIAIVVVIWQSELLLALILVLLGCLNELISGRPFLNLLLFFRLSLLLLFLKASKDIAIVEVDWLQVLVFFLLL